MVSAERVVLKGGESTMMALELTGASIYRERFVESLRHVKGRSEYLLQSHRELVKKRTLALFMRPEPRRVHLSTAYTPPPYGPVGLMPRSP